MEAAAGESGDGSGSGDSDGAAAVAAMMMATVPSPPPLLSPSPGPTDQGFQSDIDDFPNDTNAEFTITLLWGVSRYPPNMRRPQETVIDIPGVDNDSPPPSPLLSPSPSPASTPQASDPQALPAAEKNEHARRPTGKVVSSVVSSVMAVAIVIGAVLWLKRKRSRKAAHSLQPPHGHDGHRRNGSFSSLHSTTSSNYPGVPGPIRLHSSSSLDALMSPFANSPLTPHAPSRPVARQQEMTQVPPGSGPGRGPGSAGRHLMAGPTPPPPPPPPPPLPRRAQSDHISQRQYQYQHQLQNDPPPLPHRNISYQSLAPPLPPRAHELPPSLPPRDRSNTFSDIPADDLPPYVDPIEEAMAAANSGDGDGNGDGTGPAADLAPASASATASASASLQQSHGRQQDPPPYHAIDSTPGAPFSLHGNGLRP